MKPLLLNLLLVFCCQILFCQDIDLIPYRVKDKWGYSNAKGKIIFKAIYDDAGFFYIDDADTVAIVEKGGKSFFVTLKNGLLGKIPPGEKKAAKFEQGDKKAEEYNFENNVSETLNPVYLKGLVYEQYLGNNFYKVSKNGKFGLLDSSGLMLIPCKYDHLFKIVSLQISKGFLIGVGLNGKFGIMDTEGNLILPISFTEIGYGILDNCLELKKEKQIAIFDGTKMKIVALLTYDKIFDFCESNDCLLKSVIVKKKNKFGVLNSQYNQLLPCIYDSIKNIGDEIVGVYKYNKWGLFSHLGKYKTPFLYDYLEGIYFDKLIFFKRNNKWGAIDKVNGHIKIINKFQKIEYCDCNKNLIRVIYKGKEGYMNPNGYQYWQD